MNTGSFLHIVAELKHLAIIRDFIRNAATVFEVDPSAIPDILQAVDESATNIIEHGYRGQPGPIDIEVKQEGDSLVVRLRDQAMPFDPTRIPAPDVNLPLEQRPVGGLGVYLTRRFTDAMIHRVTPQGGNELTLVKKTFFGRDTREGGNT